MKKVLLLLLPLLMFLSSGVVAYADRSDVDSVTFLVEGSSIVTDICKRSNAVADKQILVYTAGDGLVSFSNKLYAELDSKAKREFMEFSLSSIKESGMSSNLKNKFYNFVADQDSTASAAVKFLRTDASADFATAMSWFRPFSGVFGVVLGFLSLMIFLCLGVTVAFDLAYITLPLFRWFVETRLPVVSEKRKAKNMPMFVSVEAYATVRECESSTDYISPVGLYLQRKSKSMVILSIALGYLITGQVYDVIAFLIDAFTGIF